MTQLYDQQPRPQRAPTSSPLSPVSFVERSAEVFGDLPAVVHGRRRYTWAQTRERSARLAAALRALGVGRDSTVSVMLHNTPEMVEAHYAVPALNAVLNTLNTRLDAPLLAWQMNHCEAHGADHRPRVRADDARGAAPAAQRAWPRAGRDRRLRQRVHRRRRNARHARVRSAARSARPAAACWPDRRTSGTRSPSATPRAPPATRRASSPTTAAPT